MTHSTEAMGTLHFAGRRSPPETSREARLVTLPPNRTSLQQGDCFAREVGVTWIHNE
jgi:hypothetical protein